MLDTVIERATLGRRHTPPLRRRLHQHLARGGTCLAQRLEHQAHAFRSIRILVAVFRIAHRLQQRDPGKIRLQFIGHDTRQRGAYTLPHFAAAHRDLHAAIGAEGHEQVGLEVHLVGARAWCNPRAEHPRRRHPAART